MLVEKNREKRKQSDKKLVQSQFKIRAEWFRKEKLIKNSMKSSEEKSTN